MAKRAPSIWTGRSYSWPPGHARTQCPRRVPSPAGSTPVRVACARRSSARLRPGRPWGSCLRSLPASAAAPVNSGALPLSMCATLAQMSATAGCSRPAPALAACRWQRGRPRPWRLELLLDLVADLIHDRVLPWASRSRIGGDHALHHLGVTGPALWRRKTSGGLLDNMVFHSSNGYQIGHGIKLHADPGVIASGCWSAVKLLAAVALPAGCCVGKTNRSASRWSAQHDAVGHELAGFRSARTGKCVEQAAGDAGQGHFAAVSLSLFSSISRNCRSSHSVWDISVRAFFSQNLGSGPAGSDRS